MGGPHARRARGLAGEGGRAGRDGADRSTPCGGASALTDSPASGSPSAPSTRFAGLTSRCATRRACRCASALSTQPATQAAEAGGNWLPVCARSTWSSCTLAPSRRSPQSRRRVRTIGSKRSSIVCFVAHLPRYCSDSLLSLLHPLRMLAQPRGRALAIDINGVAAGALLHFAVPPCRLIRILVKAMVAALVCPAEDAARVLRS